MNRTRDYLEDLLNEIALVEQFTVEGEQSFYTDDRTQYAVMMAYARIGEIAKRIPDAVLATRPEIEWRDLKGFRDILLHRYNEINPEIVWQAVLKLPALRAAIEALLAMQPPDDEDS